MLTISFIPKPFRGHVATIERFGANQRGGNRKHVLERIVPVPQPEDEPALAPASQNGHEVGPRA